MEIFTDTLTYSEDILLEFIGTPDAVLNFFDTASHSADVPFIVYSKDEEGHEQIIPPVTQFWSQLEKLRNSLVASRGAERIEESADQVIMLPEALNPYLDELPDRLTPNLIRPLTGIIPCAALLPVASADRWRKAAESYEVLQELKAQIFSPEDIPPVSYTYLPPSLSTRQEKKRVDGFVVVNIKDYSTLGCKHFRLQDRNILGDFFHCYTFTKQERKISLQAMLTVGAATLSLSAGSVQIKEPVQKQAIDTWSVALDENEYLKHEIGFYIRNEDEISPCIYSLAGECQQSQLTLEPVKDVLA